jgi:prolipoprotein diacylglyceryltransferase
LYSLIRVVLELLRVDPATVFMGERLNFWVALAGVIAGGAAFVYYQWVRSDAPTRAVPSEI